MDNFSFLNAAHSGFFSELYDQYLKDPDSLEPSWKAFFQGYDFANSDFLKGEILDGISTQIPDHVQKEFKVINLINGYRSRGHLFTKTNPVRDRRTYRPTLEIINFGLDQDDLSTIFNAGEIIGLGPQPLSIIIKHLEDIYCQSIGVEYMYIRQPEVISWIQKKLNVNDNQANFSDSQKKKLMTKLIEAVSFENFLHTKYVGQKRFSLEGGESLIPALDILIEEAANKGVEEFVMGMAHRGRLSTLVNIFGKSAKSVFSEFDGKDYEEKIFDGDVKYHLGWTSQRVTENEKKINLNIAPNPSHLETVGSVVQGISRSKLDKYFKNDSRKVLPIIVHGDAAIAGQGLVYELVQMARLEGYQTGGTIHVVVNNQIGFTTNYLDGRSSTYCTDVGKVTLSPVLHVNADDVEAVVHAVLFALDFRLEFKRDVFIDLLGYRKYGHNEGDEPRFTQPKLYKSISGHPSVKQIYSNQLVNEDVISLNDVKKIEEDYSKELNEDLTVSKKEKNVVITPFMQHEWKGLSRAKRKEMLKTFSTKIKKDDLNKVAESIFKFDDSNLYLKKVVRLMNERNKMFFDEDKIDWAIAELLAYGTLLNESFNVRISGQDVERGTFSHRHAILKTEKNEKEFIPLNNISKNQGSFQIYNSSLSEYGVMGFEYGYALANPNTLTVWEAQFGDFSNGAQIIIDQYLFSGEDKWKTQNGLVLFLPHGYEGQGAEHSSARMERYLQLCAKDNVFVANCTTPANMFHILRRQLKANYRKPLIIFTPKSLLRHPMVHSSVDEFVKGEFNFLIDDNTVLVEDVKSLVFVTGKFYYDIFEERDRLGRKDIAIVRLEQLFPLPKEHIRSIIKKYKNADDIVWAQEEPINMGAYAHLLINLKEASSFRIASRRFYAATAAGSSARHIKRHKEVIDYVFDKTKNNQIPE